MDPPRDRDVYRARSAYPMLIIDASEARAAEENREEK
jgi:hypothetical protein